MATLAATPDPAGAPPSVLLDLESSEGWTIEQARIVRVEAGRSTAVRAADPAEVFGTRWVGFDYEAPFGRQFFYETTFVEREDATVLWAETWTNLDDWSTSAGVSVDAGEVVMDEFSVMSRPLDGVTEVRVDVTMTDTVDMIVSIGFVDFVVRVTTDGTFIIYTEVAAQFHSQTYEPGMVVSFVRQSGRIRVLVAGELVADVTAGPSGDFVSFDALSATRLGPVTLLQVAATTQTVTATSPAVTLDVDDMWLIHPGEPSRSVKVPLLTSIEPRTRSVVQGVFAPLGQADPVVVTDGRRKSPSGEYRMMSVTRDEHDDLLAALSTAVPMLVNFPVSAAEPSVWVAFGEVVEAPLRGGSDERLWRLPFQTVGRPPGRVGTLRTYGTVLAEHDSYAEVFDRYDSYADLLTGSAAVGHL